MRVFCRVDSAHAKHAHLSVFAAEDVHALTALGSVLVNRPEISGSELDKRIAAGGGFIAELTLHDEKGPRRGDGD